MKLNINFFVRLLSLSLFILCAMHFIYTWIYFFINPFVCDKLIGFTWLGIFVNLIEILYSIWFCEYYNSCTKGE